MNGIGNSFNIMLAYYIKCEESVKIKHLFELYDLKKEGGIAK